VLVGITAWTEPTLVAAGYYPPDADSAEDRLRFYASEFPITEVDSTYYAPPSERVAALWAARTPDDFVFDVKAFRLLTEHPTPPKSLWKDLREALPADLAQKRNVYPKDVGPEVMDEALDRFVGALEPLRAAGKLGVLLFQLPEYVHPVKRSYAHLDWLAERLAKTSDTAAIEFRQRRWMDEDHRETTLSFLEERGFAYVCVDEPQGFPSSLPPVAATTADVAVVRFHGRNADTWKKKGITAAERFAYDYTEHPEELEEWVPKVAQLHEDDRPVHALMNNCYSDYAVNSGRYLAQLLDDA
jgi:uncharacterized protein YecE (DUF72 family)